MIRLLPIYIGRHCRILLIFPKSSSSSTLYFNNIDTSYCHEKFPLRGFSSPPSRKTACQKVNGKKLAEKRGPHPPSQTFSVTRVFEPLPYQHQCPFTIQSWWWWSSSSSSMYDVVIMMMIIRIRCSQDDDHHNLHTIQSSRWYNLRI